MVLSPLCGRSHTNAQVSLQGASSKLNKAVAGCNLRQSAPLVPKSLSSGSPSNQLFAGIGPPLAQRH